MNTSADNSPTILIVEDDSAMRDLMILALRKVECRILTAMNGKDALSRYLAYRPNLVILDILLPWMNGLDFLRELQAQNAIGATPILVVSALGYQDIVQQAIEGGASDFLVKPFDVDVLIKRVERMLPVSTPE